MDKMIELPEEPSKCGVAFPHISSFFLPKWLSLNLGVDHLQPSSHTVAICKTCDFVSN